ncbi:MAG: zinc-binding alcohol dehydrogenase [Winogradskyella sp.]|uniref:zinc-dependent alcohol dehydrogenase n=1 Tax=Winogradskyella sp. TaxID=1883156 RepID=UPI0025F8B241|nr:zinc-binding alcohol dehydrogenase [Winogradskyella sp.]NRB83707.1 zinc-binding alcohol dehydrogenase [Winogradskyella sp.]
MNKKIVFQNTKSVLCRPADEIKIASPEDILIETNASIISTGTELSIWAGLESWAPLPYIPGYGSVGTILEVGDSVNDLKEGDTIFTHGPHQKFALAKNYAQKIPKGLDPKVAVFTRMGGVAITSVMVSNAKIGDNVAVCGLGLVGNLAAQMFRLAGCNVIGIDVSSAKLESAKSCGIELVIDGSSNVMNQIMELTNGHGVDTFVDATGVSKVIIESVDAISAGGECILLGTPRGNYQTDVVPLLRKIHIANTNIQIKGAHEWKFPRYKFQTQNSQTSIERNNEKLLQFFSDGKLNTEPLLSHLVTPEEAPTAYEALKNKDENYFGVVINWN